MPEPISGKIQQAADMLASSNVTGLDANAMLISLVAHGARIPIPPTIFKEVFEAWQTRQGLSVTYVHGMTGKIVRYVIEPHVLSFYDGLWYVKAIVVSQDGGILPERTIRTLAVNRFRTAVIYPAPFAPDMRLIREVNEGTLFNFPTVKEVVLRFKGKAVPYARENHDASQIEEQSDGSLLVTVRNAIDFKIVNLVLNEGGDVVVVTPPELAKKVVEQAKAVIQAQEEP
jgi:predicted DNA-binding transcriptional regulator YafY